MDTQSLVHSKNESILSGIFDNPSNGWPKHLYKLDSKPDNNANITKRKGPETKIDLLEYDVKGNKKAKHINGTKNYETTMTNVRSLPLITDMLLDQSKI